MLKHLVASFCDTVWNICPRRGRIQASAQNGASIARLERRTSYILKFGKSIFLNYFGDIFAVLPSVVIIDYLLAFRLSMQNNFSTERILQSRVESNDQFPAIYLLL